MIVFIDEIIPDGEPEPVRTVVSVGLMHHFSKLIGGRCRVVAVERDALFS